jgi:aminobenzoyl-glutamate utilization protein B
MINALHPKFALKSRKILQVLGALMLTPVLTVSADNDQIIRNVDARSTQNAAIAKELWDLAETSFEEEHSSLRLQRELEVEGFKIQQGVAGMPTAFIASYGRGGPVIGILAEFDALPGISQAATPTRSEIAGKHAGHACGHNLFAAGSIGAALAVKQWLKNSGTRGTIRVYGTPAEEGGGGKTFFVNSGLLNDVDAALHWHPAATNDASNPSSYAIISAKFAFSGYSAHAAATPHHGRSALDGVESLNYMVNLMREHVPADTRMHYVITQGGEAPNVVPDKAEVHYFLRNPDSRALLEIWERVQHAAKGAAMGTGTEVDIKVDGGVYNVLRNDVLANVVDRHLREVGGVHYNREETKFAKTISKTFKDQSHTLTSATDIQPLNLQIEPRPGSTDVGDVSWVVPTVGLYVATWVPGTTPHSWQSTAASGHSIGFKGAQVAAKVMALTAVELFEKPELRKQALNELRRRQGKNFRYQPLAGDGIAPTAKAL